MDCTSLVQRTCSSPPRTTATCCCLTSRVDHSTDGSSGVRLQSWLDVLGLGARTDDAQSNGLVVLELEVKDGFDDGLTHGESVLRFALLDDTEAGCCVVRGEEAVECQWDFH